MHQDNKRHYETHFLAITTIISIATIIIIIVLNLPVKIAGTGFIYLCIFYV